MINMVKKLKVCQKILFLILFSCTRTYNFCHEKILLKNKLFNHLFSFFLTSKKCLKKN